MSHFEVEERSNYENEGEDEVFNRRIVLLTVTLSKKDLRKDWYGYQGPIDQALVDETIVDEDDYYYQEDYKDNEDYSQEKSIHNDQYAQNPAQNQNYQGHQGGYQNKRGGRGGRGRGGYHY